jgi:WD40 repeat protein
MTAASSELKEALARGLAGLGSQFSEFRWMLAGLQDTLGEMRVEHAMQLAFHREQLDLQRQQLVKTNLILQRQRERVPSAMAAIGIEEGELPVSDLTPAEVACPYMGLAAFEAQDADYFFGREELVAELTARLAGTRFLAVVGPSGSGKSSLVKAGLLPAVWAGALPGSEDWQTLVLTPGAHPLEELAVRVSLLRGLEPSALHEALQERPQALHLAVKQALADQGGEARLLLVVDQFEEVFALCHDEAERGRFIEALVHAVEAEEGNTIVLLTVRADFYGRCADYADLAGRLSDGLLVGPMSADELRAAIEEPAAVVGLRLEAGLAETILDDVAGEPGALPLMSHALLETFGRRRGAEMTLSGYAASGGVSGAIAQTADTVYEGLDPEEQALARSIFLRLTELGEEGAQDTRRRVAPGELVRREEESAAVEAVLKTLADARLVTTGEGTVEVAHEALIREWPALRGWLEEDREGLRVHRHLTDAAQEWERLGREEGELYRGARLAAAGEWAEAHGEVLNPLEREFLAESKELAWRREAEREARQKRELEAARRLAAEQQKLAAEQEKRAESEQRRAEEQAKSAGRLRRRALLLAGAMVVAVMLAAVALWAFRQADRSAERAQVASTQAISERYAAETAQVLEAEQRATAVAEGYARATQQAVAEAEADARATAQAAAEAAEADALTQAGIGLASQAALEMTGPNPERAVLLALEAVGHYPYSWQTERALAQAVLNNKLLFALPHGGEEVGAELSPDGTKILTSGNNGLVKVWDASTGQELLSFAAYEGPSGFGGDALWSPAGDRILTMAAAGPKVWEATTGALLFDLSSSGHSVAGWSPDGTRITTFGHYADPAPKVWDASTGDQLFTLPVPAAPDARMIVHWSPDSRRILTEEGGIWDAATGQELQKLPVEVGATYGGVGWPFSPDGERIVTAELGEPGRIWDTFTGDAILVFDRPAGGGFARWSPAGDRILTFGGGIGDRLAQVWDAETGAELFQLAGVTQGSWSADGQYILTDGGAGEAKVWALATGSERLSFTAHSGAVNPKDWLPSGERFITASPDGTAKVWDAKQALFPLGCQPSCPPSLLGGWYFVPAWSPDGHQVARGFSDGTVTVWDVATGSELYTLQYEPLAETMFSGFAIDVSWSPDGKQLLFSMGDGVAMVWDAASGDELLRLPADVTDRPVNAAWSPDGERIVTMSQAGPIRVRDAITGQELLTFNEALPYAVSWSPDGSRIVSADFTSTGGGATVRDSATGEVLLDLFPADFQFGVGAVAYSPDGTRIVAFSEDELGRVFDASRGEVLLTFPGVVGTWGGATWSPSGARFLICGSGGAVKVFDATTGNVVVNLNVGMAAQASWSPDGTWLAIGDWDGNLKIYPAWESLEELIDYARDCCVFRELAAEEREQFGLPVR